MILASPNKKGDVDFTHERYEKYIQVIKLKYKNIITFEELFLTDLKPDSFCIIRHDVDRKPGNALIMAEIEYRQGVRSSYYFRAKSNSFKPHIIKKIVVLGHEIGYHYENLPDAKGVMRKALQDFETKLNLFRGFYPVRTISMHGRPLSRYHGHDLWKAGRNHDLLQEYYGILGDIVLDIDYTDIAYINDTGRNWYSHKQNIQDRVGSSISVEFASGKHLYEYLISNPHRKMVFQIHPERWTSHPLEYMVQRHKDHAINIVKALISKIDHVRGS